MSSHGHAATTVWKPRGVVAENHAEPRLNHDLTTTIYKTKYEVMRRNHDNHDGGSIPS